MVETLEQLFILRVRFATSMLCLYQNGLFQEAAPPLLGNVTSNSSMQDCAAGQLVRPALKKTSVTNVQEAQ